MNREKIKQRGKYVYNQNRGKLFRIVLIVSLLSCIPQFFNPTASQNVTDTTNFTATVTKLTPNHIIFTILSIAFMCVSHGLVVSMLKAVTNRAYAINDEDSLAGFKRFFELFPTYFIRALLVTLLSITPCFGLIFLAFVLAAMTHNVAIYVIILLIALVISITLFIRNTARYAMVPYLLEERGIRNMQAMKESTQMMRNHVMDYIMLILSFVPWYLVIVIIEAVIAFILGLFMPAPLVTPIYTIAGAIAAAYLFKGDLAATLTVFYEELAYRYFR